MLIDGRDFGGILGSLIFTFDSTHSSFSPCVSLIKDNIHELTEVLEATLSSSGQPPSRVSIASTRSTVTIFDDDGSYIIMPINITYV